VSDLRWAVKAHKGRHHAQSPINIELHARYVVQPHIIFLTQVGQDQRAFAGQPNLSAVTVTGKLQDNLLGLHGLIGIVTLMGQQNHRCTRGDAGEGQIKIVLALPHIVDSGQIKRFAAALQCHITIEQQPYIA